MFERLAAAYNEPHRAYHTLEHLTECFAQLDGARPADRPAEVELALWFHDAIYDTRAADNEARSADWARGVLADARVDTDSIQRIEALILVTRHDASPTDDDQRIVLDVDLSILGAPAERFAAYESQIRQEYAWVPEDVYCAERTKVLRSFQDRAVLYYTAHFRERLEAQARKNLGRSLEALAG